MTGDIHPFTRPEPAEDPLAGNSAPAGSPRLVVERLEQVRSILLADLERAFALLRTLPPAVTFFGGARIRPDDPYYAISRELGRLLAATGIPPRTGAGPGIMQSVPEGYKEGLATGVALVEVPPVLAGFSDEAHPDDRRTQGFNIVLPFEQGLNRAIDRATAIDQFPFRKLGLYENVRGMVTFPGGFGTLDELFEVWSLAGRGLHNDPMVVVGREFWQPILDVLRALAVDGRRRLIEPEAFARLLVSDDPREVIEHVALAPGVRGFEQEPAELARRMAREMSEAIRTLEQLPPAVTFFGGRLLAPDDPACALARELARRLHAAGLPVRLGGPGALADAVVRGTRADDPAATVQGFLIGEEAAALPAGLAGLVVHQVVTELITHKELLERNTLGLVFLPGGLGTLSELFTALCQMQTGKVARRPVVLIGEDFWGPLFDVLRRTLLRPERQTISPEDLELVQITDDPDEVLAAVSSLHASPAPGTP